MFKINDILREIALWVLITILISFLVVGCIGTFNTTYTKTGSPLFQGDIHREIKGKPADSSAYNGKGLVIPKYNEREYDSIRRIK